MHGLWISKYQEMRSLDSKGVKKKRYLESEIFKNKNCATKHALADLLKDSEIFLHFSKVSLEK